MKTLIYIIISLLLLNSFTVAASEIIRPRQRRSRRYSVVINGHAHHLGTHYEKKIKEVEYKKVLPGSRGQTPTEITNKIETYYEAYPLNEKNIGLGLEYNLNNGWYFNGGFYKDSFNKYQVYTGGIKRWNLFEYNEFKIDYGMTIGLMTHSKFKDGKVPIPGILPITSIGYGDYTLNLSYVPAFKGNSVDLIWAQFKINF